MLLIGRITNYIWLYCKLSRLEFVYSAYNIHALVPKC